jgi:pimeloyl-ACP methyl ester carboxylesterase
MSAIFKSEAARDAVHGAYRRALDAWPVPHEELRVAAREGETFVVACGDPAAPPVILLHGAQSNAAGWMFDAALFSRAFRVLAVDLIGEAGFSAPSRPPLQGEAYALWLDDVLAGLGVERAAFVGVSLGGWLALDYAVRRPGRISRLALLCPAGVGAQKNFLLRAAPLLLLGPWGANKVGEMVFGPRPKITPESARPLSEMMGLILRGYRPRALKIPAFSNAALAGLAMPVLAILGGRDVLLDTAGARERLCRLVPEAEIAFLPEARHFIPGQGPRIFDFLRAGEA